MLRRYPTARSSRYTPLVGCAFLVETLYGSKYSANLGLYSMPYVYVKTVLLCATGHGLKLREGRYLHGLVELLLPSKGSQDNLTKLELLQFIDGISSDSSAGCNDEAFRADEGEADEQATLAHLSSVHDDSGRVATAVSTIREDYGVSSSSSLYNEHETAPNSGQDYNHKHYGYLKGVGTEDGGVDYAGARFGSDAAAEGARLRAEGADEDAVAVESIMSFVSATAFPPTIARVLIYDAVCTCVADGRYSAKEKERVALVSSHIGLSSAVRSQIEKLALQEKVISIRKRRLLRLHSTHSNTTPLGEVRHCPALSAAHGVTNSSMHHERKQGGASVTRRGEISDSCDCRVAEENRDTATDDEAMRVEAAKKLLRRARAHRLPQRYVGA
ncbi:hypothetical protein JKF63_04871 [Porcisia hertigi]|uniref:Uncharacterized protein n=1 Tax=Porcisia hertigi TaxID=2761500 RepID=A0A836I3N1_9TRYP|nr:hypothetical protein JKF63_04871 [Porcisia hertigi]